MLDFQPGIIGRPGGNSPNYSANGAGVQGNYWMLDGVENVNIFVNSGPLIGAGTSTDELTLLPADAIQEVNVMANPSAEFGWFQGAVVNVGLKSGTNVIHGSVYAFGRNNSLEAYNPYQNGITPALPTINSFSTARPWVDPSKKTKYSTSPIMKGCAILWDPPA